MNIIVIVTPAVSIFELSFITNFNVKHYFVGTKLSMCEIKPHPSNQEKENKRIS